jgi:methyl-accepting chemotaxis protein
MIFDALSLKQRVAIQVVLTLSLQVFVVTGTLLDLGHTSMIVGSLSIGGFLLWLYLDSAASTGKFVVTLIDSAHRMGDGDLSQDLPSFGNPTVREGLHTMQALQERIRSMMHTLSEGAQEVSTASSEIAAGNQDLSERTEQGSSDLQSAASAMREMTEAARHSSESMGQAASLSQSTSQLAQQSGLVVSQAVTAMSGVSQSSRKIADIISVIDGIAFQTNILALNAAVEAARAGEQGRGFAVVASEVRSLAGRSADAAKEIKSLINSSVEQVDAGSHLVNEAGNRMHDVVGSIERVAGLITEATAIARTQSSGLQGIADSVDRLDQTMQQNAALVEEGAAAASSLKQQAGLLTELVSQFRLR